MASVFNKELPRSCKYCVYGNLSVFSNEIICKKYGITSTQDSCRHYKYDPIKRIPLKSEIAGNYKPEDFLLE